MLPPALLEGERRSCAIWYVIFRQSPKATHGNRRRYVEITRGSALACAAIQDVLPVCDAMSADDNRKQKALPDRRVAELAKIGQRGYAIRGALGESGVDQFDTDTDSDTDTD
jgi:hypothetical protein